QRKTEERRAVAQPYFSLSASGTIVLPRLFDIFAPSLMIKPCARNFRNGSSKSIKPRSFKAIVTKRAYIKCRTACSLPPMYVCTGNHLRVRHASNGMSSRSLLGYRKKYQALSRNVSETSVSRRPGPPHTGQVVSYH